MVERPSRRTRTDMEDDGKLNKQNERVPHYHQEKSQTFFAIKPDKEDKEENDASIFIGQVKHLEFDLIRNQSH